MRMNKFIANLLIGPRQDDTFSGGRTLRMKTGTFYHNDCNDIHPIYHCEYMNAPKNKEKRNE